MAKVHRSGKKSRAHGGSRARLLGAAIVSLTVSAVVVASAARSGAPLGALAYWPWLLTGLQVLALWSAGTGRWWGWLLGAAVQSPWIAYAVVTAQLGFIPGCAISAVVQTHSFLAGGASAIPRRATGARRVEFYA